MKGHTCLLALGVVVCFQPAMFGAQDTSRVAFGRDSTADFSRMLMRGWVVAGQVKTLAGDPVPKARVVVQPANAPGEIRTLQADLQGKFSTQYMLNLDLVKELNVDLVVTSKGFRKAHQVVEFSSSDKVWSITVTLREAGEDPELLPQADLLAALAPRLKTLGAADGLPSAGEKDYLRGVAEFLDRKRPDPALPHLRRVVNRAPSCVQCRTMMALAELESGDWDGADRNLREAVDKILAEPRLGRSEPLLAAGVMMSWRHEAKKSAGYFTEALKFAPQDALALQELGRSQLLLQNWEVADTYLVKALAAGAGPEARFLRARALLGGGNPEEANAELTHYLDGREVKKMPLPVRQLWAQIKNRADMEAIYAKRRHDAKHSIDYLQGTPPGLEGLDPATDQAELDAILRAVGKNVAGFFRDFSNTSSLEQIHQEALNHKGKVDKAAHQKFQYLCLTPSEGLNPVFTEYRADLSGRQALQHGLKEGFMLTTGFTSSTFVFHPAYQSQSTFHYVGHQKINGRDNYVIAYAQKPSKAHLYGSFKWGDYNVATFTQGLAWVDRQSYEIVRLRTDLLAPLDEVKLERETTEIDFGEVHYKRLRESFWLPQQVTVTIDWNGKLLRNQHQYSQYKLFNVEAKQKIGKPKNIGEVAEESPQTE